LLGNEISDRGVTLQDEVPEGIIAQGDENHLIQILINLVHNSLDALQGRESPTILVKAVDNGPRIELIVRDNGSGIPKANLAKIFDPFFTTKPVGQGMGMGLSLCFRMIQGMGGEVHVDSVEGSHTQFTLSLVKPVTA
jgi:C4-dicarboxylate-specific signal transduction histidine kinase